jgi:uncharacterized protein DUF1236
MRTKQHTVLAGIAAIVLLAGTGLALAQDAAKDQKQPGAAPQPKAAPPAATQQIKPGPANNPGPSAQKTEEKGKGSMATQQSTGQKAQSKAVMEQGKTLNAHDKNRTAQQINRGSKANKMSRTTSAAQLRQTAQGQEQRKGLQGLQGNATKELQNGTVGQNAQGAAGMNVQLTDQQRTQIRDTVIGARNAPRAGQVDFAVAPGTVIPRGRIHVVPVPRTLVRIEPEWRGYLYFVYEDELIIVNPRDMRIVAVVNV